MTHFDVIIRGGDVVGSTGTMPADVGIAGESIVAIAPEIAGSAREEIDARGLCVFPGAVDIHVHFNEPGRTEWEGWATGSAACAVGGTTTVADMPLNSDPPTLDAAAFSAKRAAAEARSIVDFALWGGLTPDSLDRMDEMVEAGAVGFKAFMSNSGIAEFGAADDATLCAGMTTAARLDVPVAVHAENDAVTAAMTTRAIAAGKKGIRDYLASRPAVAEIEAISRAILFAEETGCALHVAHVSTGRGVAAIAAARARGVDVTAETCPHYLLFDEEDAARIGAVAKCAPPLRRYEDVKSLRRALASRDIQIVASDHSPAPPDMKSGDDFFRIWGGISGCQTLLTAILGHGHVEWGLSLPALARVLAEAPAQRLRIPRKGRIAEGFDADLVLVDLGESYTLRGEDLRYRHRHSSYVGMRFLARPVRTLRRGETIALEGQPVAASVGRLVRPGVRDVN